jgi:hypothetical protein
MLRSRRRAHCMKSVKHIADDLVLANTLMFVHIRRRRRGITTGLDFWV